MSPFPYCNGHGHCSRNASLQLGETEMEAYCGVLKYAMYMMVPEMDEKVLFYVFSPALLEMSPSFREAADRNIQLDFIDTLAIVIGARKSWHHGTKTKAQEFCRMVDECYALPILIELEKTDKFTYYHLFGFDASVVKFIRGVAKANFDLYRIYNVIQRGMFGLSGRILRVDASDCTFRMLLGEVLNKEQLISGQRDA